MEAQEIWKSCKSTANLAQKLGKYFSSEGYMRIFSKESFWGQDYHGEAEWKSSILCRDEEQINAGCLNQDKLLCSSVHKKASAETRECAQSEI